jgi:epoxyqueuosine reductase
MTTDLKTLIAKEAAAAGFDVVRVTNIDSAAAEIGRAGGRLDAFLADGRHGDMAWMATHHERRRDPRVLWPQVRSIVMLGLNYGPAEDPIATKVAANRAVISAYARGRDYHDLAKAGLKRVARVLQQASGAEVRVFVDTAPLMEKPLAAAAGLGWQGKHTNLVSRQLGSWLFLGAILTTADIEADAAEDDHCGTCTRCLDVCPTNAFVGPYQLDPRKCIAYLTIEYKGHIADDFREAIGNRVFGCDDCLAVCPWNKFAATTHEMRFHARVETDNPPIADILALDEAEFRSRFAGTPVKRTGRDRVVRNALIAAGNAGDATLLPQIEKRLDDGSPLVRAMAVWALGRLGTYESQAAHIRNRAHKESDRAVIDEWAKLNLALSQKGTN